MFKNYLKTAFRNLWKNKVISSINIFGLALGIACSLLIMLWVSDEKSFDAFHKNAPQLYSIIERQYRDGKTDAFFGGPGVMADEMKKVLPEVQYATNYAWNQLATFEANNKIIKESGNHAGKDFFKMFTYPLLQGNVNTALLNPLDVAISKKMAEEFFGSASAAFGRTIRYQNKKDLKITAVFNDVPANSTAQFDYILNWQSFLEGNGWAKDWTNNGPQTFIMLRKGTDAATFEKKIARFLDAYNKEQTPRSYVRLGMLPYGDVYLHGDFKDGELSGGRIEYVRLFSIIGIFILLIACINFMNLTTARSVKRAREIGVRKVIGAMRLALVQQFIGEALLVASIALVIVLILVTLILPQFNQITGKQITIPYDDYRFWLKTAGLLSITGFVSGSYPALYLSSFKPVQVLKGVFRFRGNVQWFRKGLVVFQFMLSIMLIISTIVVSRQVSYIQDINLGYDRENLLYLPVEGDLADRYDVFKIKALQTPGVKAISRMTDAPTQISNGTGGVNWEGKDPNADIDFSYARTGYDLQRVLRFQLKEGRDFSKDFATDSAAYLINEAALKIIGYKDPVGKALTFWGTKGKIIGIVKDFHFNSLHEPIRPFIFSLGENIGYGNILVRTQAGKTKEALSALEGIWKQLNPGFPFTFKFSDEEYQKLYRSEQVVKYLSNCFAFLAIFISCLGLLGLVIFTAEQRRKEFGIRKVLGANAVTLFGLLSREFLGLVCIALLIAAPLAWLGMSKWLQDYAYHTSIPWWTFLLAGLGTLLIALITVSFQSIRAAVANPVKSLRTEG